MRRRMLRLLLLLPLPVGGAMAPAMPVPPPERVVLAPDAESQWVPFELTPSNQIQFRMTVDGRAVTAILDTGCSASLIARRWATDAGLKVTRGNNWLGTGGLVAVDQTIGRTLAIGGLTRSGGKLGVVDLPTTLTGSAQPLDMVIGSDLLRRYALDIDFANRRFRLIPSGRLPFPGQTAPLEIARDQLYISEMTVNGTRLRPMIVDTGDGRTIAMSNEAWRSLAASPDASTTTLSYSVTGPVVTDLAVLPAIRVGESMMDDVEVMIEPGRGFSAQMGAAGRIGLGYLQRYRVLLDPGAGRMVMAGGDDLNQPRLRSTSGLLFLPASDRLRVVHVMRGSPAAGMGWKAGEDICSVDGQIVTADYASRPIASWSADRPGRVVRLGVCGGSERQLRLERFY